MEVCNGEFRGVGVLMQGCKFGNVVKEACFGRGVMSQIEVFRMVGGIGNKFTH